MTKFNVVIGCSNILGTICNDNFLITWIGNIYIKMSRSIDHIICGFKNFQKVYPRHLKMCENESIYDCFIILIPVG